MGTLNHSKTILSHSILQKKQKGKSKPVVTRSYSTHWLIQTTAILSVIMFLTAAVLVFVLSSSTITSMRSNLSSRTNVAVRFFNRYFYASDTELNTAAKAFVEEYEDKNLVEIQFLTNTGRVLYSSSGYAAGISIRTDDLTSSLKSGTTSSWTGTDELSGEYVMAVSTPIVFPSGEIAGVIRCISGMEKVRTRIITYSIIAFFICLVIVSVLSAHNRFFVRSLLNPLQVVNNTAMQIAEGRYGVHIEQNYTNEIGTLCKTINDMSDAISRAEKTKNEFISNISHELRTPLTAIGGWSETLLGTAGLSDNEELMELQRGLTIIRDESARLTRLVEELLDFSRMETGELRMTMERADIIPDLEDVVFMYMDTLRKEEIMLEFHEEEEFPEIVCDRARLKQVFLNILDNARKHGGDGKRIVVTAVSDGTMIQISFRDFGQGIAPEELPRVRERFYKGSSRARGNGIGLAVADEIIRLHGGKLNIDSTLGEGTTVTIELPVSQ